MSVPVSVKVLPGLRDELPVVCAGAEVQLEDAIGVGVAHLAVGLDVRDRVVAPSARAHHELPDAMLGIGGRAGRLWREALVDVLVAVEDHVGIELVERGPERPDGSVVPV